MTDTDGIRIPFRNLGRSTRRLRGDLDAAAARVLASSRFVLGAEVAAFEQEFAVECGAAYAVGVGSGSDAIEVALRTLRIGDQDEVVTQANTCVPTIAAISRAGATPVLCDADLDTAML